MEKLRIIVGLSLIVLLSTQCSTSDISTSPTNPNPNNQNEWLVPIAQVRDGGPGKDGIPSIDNPQFDAISQVSILNDDDLVNQVYAYPHEILDWHEIVNHFANDGNLTMTYCPLTGTAIGWNPLVDGQLTQFGVSGLLYNSNLMPYDRNTNSTWSQMRLDCVNGPSINTKIKLIHLIETSYGTLKSLYPSAMVLNRTTGINRSYGQYPYGGYRTNTQLIFPVDGELDTSLHPKERVLGVQFNDETIAFRFDLFDQAESVVKETQVGGKDIVAIGNKPMNFIVAFENNLNGSKITLTGMDISGEGIATDTDGNVYNVFGQIISGPDVGSGLREVTNYIGYWFAWAAFADDIILVE